MDLKDCMIRQGKDFSGKLMGQDYNYNISDYVSIDSFYEYEKTFHNTDILPTVYASDYSKAKGIICSRSDCGYKENRQASPVYTPNPHPQSKQELECVSPDGGAEWWADNVLSDVGVCPSITFFLDSLMDYVREKNINLNIDVVRDKNGRELYHTLELGEYPQDHADNNNGIDSSRLEKLLKDKSTELTETGKSYIGDRNEDGTFDRNLEYEYKGEKYVRARSRGHTLVREVKYKNGETLEVFGDWTWFKVQPIKWIIKNWDEVKEPITATDDRYHGSPPLYLRAEDAIISGIPFYPDSTNSFGESLYINSMIRAYLNGISLKQTYNKYETKKVYDFSPKTHNGSFLAEAFDLPYTIEKKLSQEEGPKRKSRLEKLNPDTTPIEQRRDMTDTEVIKNWVDAGQSVLLTGPSGIGKTQRIKELYPDLIYIKLTNNMFPEKVVGSMNLQTGQSIPPDFAKHAILSGATKEEKQLIEENVQNLFDIADKIYERTKNSDEKVVILLDELLNVKPAVQSLVYTLVLNRIVETGKGLKLPANTVVVATGNQKKYSSVAQDLAEPLEKRFDHILDMEPKVGEWLYEFAIPKKLHPSVVGYIFSKYIENNKSEDKSKIGYFYEEPEVGEKNLDKNGCKGRTNDPRGWESISNMLYAFEEDLQKGKFVGKDVNQILDTSLKSKLRDEWAGEFYDYYIHPTLSVEDVVENNYSKEDLPVNINEKFATMAGLLGASESEVEKCREFIRENCDPEYLSVYDIYWAGKDQKRIEKIAELKELENINLESYL